MYKNRENLWVTLLEPGLTFFSQGNYDIMSFKQASKISKILKQSRIEIRDLNDNNKYIKMIILIDEAEKVLKNKIEDLEMPIVSEEQR